MQQVSLALKEGLLFEVEQDGKKYNVDASVKFGGTDQGVRPKGLLLSALGGCAGMDIASLLDKMRVDDYKLNIIVSAESVEEHPQVYKSIELRVNLDGDDIPADKAKKAVDMSITKYCPVYAMLSKVIDIKTKLFINKEEIVL